MLTGREFFSLALRNRVEAELHLKSATNVKELVEYKSLNGSTLLHLVAEEGDEKFARLLVEFGANPCTRNARCHTSVEVALICANTSTVEMFLDDVKIGRSVARNYIDYPIAYDDRHLLQKIIDCVKDAPIYYGECSLCCIISTSAKYRNPHTLKMGIMAHSQKSNAIQRWTLLGTSKEIGKNVCQFLHRKDFPNPLDIIDSTCSARRVDMSVSYTVRGLSCVHDINVQKLECLKVLLENGMDFTLPVSMGGVGYRTLAHFAVECLAESSLVVTEFILDNSRPVIKMWDRTLLDIALRYQKLETFKYLVKLGAVVGNDTIYHALRFVMQYNDYIDLIDFIMLYFGTHVVKNNASNSINSKVRKHVATFNLRVSLFDLVNAKIIIEQNKMIG